MPRVIIGSPLFNHARDFPEAIESILNQTFTDFALVLDDRHLYDFAHHFVPFMPLCGVICHRPFGQLIQYHLRP